MTNFDRTPLAQMDPAEAWQPWRPDGENPWNLKWTAHLLRRGAFGAPAFKSDVSTWERTQKAVEQGLDKTIEQVLNGEAGQAEFDRMMDEIAPKFATPPPRFSFNQDGPEHELRAWWLYRCCYTPHPLREKMTLFWHNHFATSIAKVKRTALMLRQNQTLRAHALGKFRPLLLDMSRDPAMLIWLDSNSNIKGRANENYAREVMELFSLGVGNYSETDIREAARAFTGWHTNGTEFIFNAAQHDGGSKTVLKKTGEWDGGDIIRILLEEPAAARFLTRKLYSYLISENESPPDVLLEPLAEQFRKSDYDMAALVGAMLRSRLFFSEHAFRQRIKSPAEFLVGLVRDLDEQQRPGQLANALKDLGQSLFAPPNVKGWVGGKSWLNSATLLARHNLAYALVSPTDGQQGQPQPVKVRRRGEGGPGASANPVALVKKYGGASPQEQVGWGLNLFLQGDAPPAAKEKLVTFLQEGSPKEAEWDKRWREVVHTILLMPEYQLA
jgi:uncharacterized protein (DUF1800 family)